LGGPNFAAGGGDPHAQVGVGRVKEIPAVLGAGPPGIHDAPCQGLAIGGGQVGTLPEVFAPAIEGGRVVRSEPFGGGQALGVGVAEEAAAQHIGAISLADRGEPAFPPQRGKAGLPAEVIGEPKDSVFHLWEEPRSPGAGGSRSPGLGAPGRERRVGRRWIRLGLIRLEWIGAAAHQEPQGGQG